MCVFSGLQKRREAPKLAKEAKDKNLALKVEKALRLMHDEGGLFVKDSRDACMTLITKGIKRFWRKGGNNNSSGSNSRGMSTMKVTNETICFNCGEEGHISKMCSKPKKEFTQKKDNSMMATWGESNSDEDEEGNFGSFMAEKEVTSIS